MTDERALPGLLCTALLSHSIARTSHPSSQAGAELGGHTTAWGPQGVLGYGSCFCPLSWARHQKPSLRLGKTVALSLLHDQPSLTPDSYLSFLGTTGSAGSCFYLGQACFSSSGKRQQKAGSEHTLLCCRFGKCTHPRHQAVPSRGNSWVAYAPWLAGGRRRLKLTCVSLLEHPVNCLLG